MEFLRFGSSIPGEYWGCCAGDIIQNFKQDPDTKASIQLVSGDGGGGITQGGELAFLGPTLRDVFWQRLRVSTFSSSDMPNHFFFAILEHSQIQGPIGQKWLALLKEAGFEFLRTVDNSVYTGPGVPSGKAGGSPHKNYIFFLCRNIGGGRVENPYEPPAAWTSLPTPEGMVETNDFIEKSVQIDIADQQREAHKKIWKATGPTKILKESEIVAAGAPLIMAGMRTEFPPELKAKREEKMEARKKKEAPVQPSGGTQYLYHG